MTGLQTIAIAAATGFVVSVVCCRISASITFRIIDRYVKDIVDLAMESIRDAYSGKFQEGGVNGVDFKMTVASTGEQGD